MSRTGEGVIINTRTGDYAAVGNVRCEIWNPTINKYELVKPNGQMGAG